MGSSAGLEVWRQEEIFIPADIRTTILQSSSPRSLVINTHKTAMLRKPKERNLNFHRHETFLLHMCIMKCEIVNFSVMR